MATIDEGLDAIHKKFLSWSRFDETTPESRAELNQAIKELFCKHLGCEPLRSKDDPDNWLKGKVIRGPCKWCGKEQP